MFQATLRGWKRLAAGMMLAPGVAGIGEAHAQTRFAEQSRHQPAAEAKAPSAADAGREFMRQAQAAAERKDYAQARTLAERARALRLPAQAYDQTPDQFLAEIDRRSVSRASSSSTKSAAPATPPRTTDPNELVRDGRAALEAGKIDLAQDLARQAEALKPSSAWGLFADSPRDLLKDVQRAKSKRDRAESIRLLTEARTLYERKAGTESERAANLERAQTLAYQAERLHGPYSVWDFGDRPNKLLADIESARSKLKSTTVVRRTPPKSDSAYTSPATSTPATEPVAKRPTPQVDIAQVSAKRPATPYGQPEPTAPSVRPEPTAPASRPAPVVPPPAVAHQDPAAKTKSIALMRAANALYLQGKPLEAHAKLLEAKKLNASFNGDEDSPEIVIAKLQAECAKIIARLCNEASEAMLRRNATDLTAAQAKLDEAEQLANGLGLDATAVADHRASLKGIQKSLSVAAAPAVAPAVPVAPQGATQANPQKLVPPAPAQGGVATEMLAKARLELKRGETESARRLTIEVLTSNHGGHEEAQALLRSIEAAEFNQRRQTAQNSLKTAQVKYNARDYVQALSILQLIDPALLSAGERSAQKEMMSQCSLHAPRNPAPKAPDAGVQTAGAENPMGTSLEPIPAPVTDVGPSRVGADSLIKQQEALQEINFQKLRAEGLKVQSESTAKFGKGETDAALEDLQKYLEKVKSSSVDPSKAALLTRPVENRLSQLRVLKQQQDFFTKSARERGQSRTDMTQEALTREHKQAKIKDLMKSYDALMEQHKYGEAQMLAMKANELDPDDVSLMAAVRVSKQALRVKTWENLKDGKERWNYEAGNEPHDFGPPVTQKEPIAFDVEAFRRGEKRASHGQGVGILRRLSPQEKEIERKLKNKVDVDFKGWPLTDVVEYFRSVTGLNITLDTRAMEQKNISTTQKVTETLRDIELRNALNIILKKCELTHVIEDNALKITTETGARGRQVQRVFPVADLVIPIENYGIPDTSDIHKQINRSINSQVPTINGLSGGGGVTPFTPALGMGQSTGTPVGSGTGGRLENVNQRGGIKTTVSNPQGTIQESLIKLITNTVKPESWAEVGGSGTIDYYPIGLALVINQTPDVVEQVADLLESLRRLQDLEVTIEIRLITLAEAFYERIGLDFSLNIKTNTTSFEPQLTNGTFRPLPFINDINTKGQVLGLTPAGTFTPDLDIPIRSTSFQSSTPPFGGFQSLANNGGLTLGLAFLNDIQVFMFLEASQGDRRTNVMQAPKLTMFNGQSSQIQISDQQYFVTGVTVVSVNGQIVFVPQNSPFSFGVTMSLQPVVSADRRFVRININQQMNNLASAVVPLFPITTFVTPVFEGGAQGQPIPFTQFIQQPTLSTLNVQTTVIVPDGGTVMIGGLKTLSEGRNEFGPPVLSKIPYINRLFKNVGYGREAQTLMMMVTPRIIINREEQERQTGVVEEIFSEAQ